MRHASGGDPRAPVGPAAQLPALHRLPLPRGRCAPVSATAAARCGGTWHEPCTWVDWWKDEPGPGWLREGCPVVSMFGI